MCYFTIVRRDATMRATVPYALLANRFRSHFGCILAITMFPFSFEWEIHAQRADFSFDTNTFNYTERERETRTHYLLGRRLSFHGVLFSSATWITISWHIRAKYAQLYRMDEIDSVLGLLFPFRCLTLFSAVVVAFRCCEHNQQHRPNEMVQIEFLRVKSWCYAHFHQRIYIAFNVYQYTISALCTHVRTNFHVNYNIEYITLNMCNVKP